MNTQGLFLIYNLPLIDIVLLVPAISPGIAVLE